MKSMIKKHGSDIFLEICPESREEETELAGIFLHDKIFVQDGLPEVETGRFKKLVFKLEEIEKQPQSQLLPKNPRRLLANVSKSSVTPKK